jgi:hypothetical protein
MANITVTRINKEFLDYIFKELNLDKAQNPELVESKMKEVKVKLEEAMTNNGLANRKAEIKWVRTPDENMVQWNKLIKKYKPETKDELIELLNEDELY